MFKDRRRPEDLPPASDEARRRQVPDSQMRADVERRRGERRLTDRRGRANGARRAEDAERNQHRRALLLSFLGTLSHDELLLWIDRLWLGQASEPQLENLVASVRESPHFVDRIATTRASSRGRASDAIAGIDARSNAWVNAEWRNLTEQLTVLASLRRQHHAAGNQKRNGTPKSSQYRDAGLASPIGARVRAADLFDDFFDRMELTPSEMAARLLEREVHRQLHSLEDTSSPRNRRGFGSFTAAAAAVTALALFPRWRSVYRGLRERPPTAPQTDSERN